MISQILSLVVSGFFLGIGLAAGIGLASWFNEIGYSGIKDWFRAVGRYLAAKFNSKHK